MTKSPTAFVREATGLTKQVSGLEALGMALSGMGLLYVFNAIVFTPAFYPTANPLIGGFIGLALVLPIAAMYALFSIVMPRTGGDYVWTSRVLNSGTGFVVNFSLTLLALSVIGAVGPWIPQWSLSPMFYDVGALLNNQGYMNLANYLQGMAPTFWISALTIVITGVIVIASTRLSSAIVKYWTILAVIIGLLFVWTALSAGQSTFESNFNAFYASSNVTYRSVIQEGQSQVGSFNGIPPVLSNASLYAGALGLLGYLGFYYPAYFAGEIKQNRRSQLLAQVGGSVIFAVFTTAIFAAEYFGEGPAFANAIAGLWASPTANPPNPYFTIPLASALSMFWTKNVFLVAIFNLSFGLTAIVMFVSMLFTLSRNIFAWSFDRIIPSSFASINSRTRTPVNAVILMTMTSLIYLYISIYNSNVLAVLFAYGTAGTFIAFIFVAIVAIIYPYKRKDLFENGDPSGRRRIGGIPLITILGILSAIVSAVTVYAILQPQIGGATLGSTLLYGIIPTFLIGLVIYIIAYAVRRGQGIDLNIISREVPPE